MISSDKEKIRREKISNSLKGRMPKNIDMIAGWNRGKKLSKEHRKKLSNARIGKEPWNKGKKGVQVPWNKGLVGYRAGISHPWMASGKEHYNWQGGKSFEKYGYDWTDVLKDSIRQRDNYVCQECGIHQDELSYKLHVHHIDYNKKNCNPNNLISLCRKCHLKTNYNREYWLNYFRNKKYE